MEKITSTRRKESAVSEADGKWRVEGTGKPVDLSQDRYRLAFVDAARLRPKAFFAKFGLPNSLLEQINHEVAEDLEEFRQAVGLMATMGYFPGLSDLPDPPEIIDTPQFDLARLLDDMAKPNKVVSRFVPSPSGRVQRLTTTDGTLRSALWAKLLDYAAGEPQQCATCAYCSSAFIQTDARQNFCSASCRTQASREKRS